MANSSLVDQFGFPLRSRADVHYNSASRTDTDMVAWAPRRVPAPTAYTRDHRDVVTGRSTNHARNDGWTAGGLSRLVDNIVGAGWGLNVTLPAKTLGLSEDQASELASQIEEAFDEYANDYESCDAAQQRTFGQQLAIALRHELVDGEGFASIPFLNRGTPWSTAIEMIHPARVDQPSMIEESPACRDGIEFGPYGEPVAYHIRAIHPNDHTGGFQRDTFVRAPRFVNGRRYIVHHFECTEVGQVRGVPLLSPVTKKLRMLGRYDETELQAALLNASMAMFVTSPFDHTQLAEALAGASDESDPLGDYLMGRLKYWENAPPIRLPSASINFLYPGEEPKFTAPMHPNAVFESYIRAGLRNVASSMGLSYEQFSGDWSQSNYSSARAALIEAWRGFMRRAGMLASSYVQPWYVRWFEEAVARGRVKLPAGSPDFMSAKNSWTRARWRMPGRGWVDPLKEAQAAVSRIASGVSTLERESAEQGLDWSDNLRQRARELKAARDLEKQYGLPEGTLINYKQNNQAPQGAEVDNKDDRQ